MIIEVEKKYANHNWVRVHEQWLKNAVYASQSVVL